MVRWDGGGDAEFEGCGVVRVAAVVVEVEA